MKIQSENEIFSKDVTHLHYRSSSCDYPCPLNKLYSEYDKGSRHARYLVCYSVMHQMKKLMWKEISRQFD
jgi:hypothetical protein